MSVRMKDIAHTLGISQTTVSHVLRGRDGEFRIGAKTARRVRDAVERLGYRPSVLARNLKHHRAYALALAVGDLADPFWSTLALGAQQEAEHHGYVLVVSHTGETLDKERQLLEMLRERRVDGLILAPAHLKPAHLAPLRNERRPFVLVDRTIDGLDVPSVVTAAERLFRRRPSATAVITGNLWLTIGTLRAAPEDVVVVGFDDFYLADLLRRPVTTVAQPVEDLGREAVRLLLEEVASPGGNRHVVLPPRLIVRGGGRA